MLRLIEGGKANFLERTADNFKDFVYQMATNVHFKAMSHMHFRIEWSVGAIEEEAVVVEMEIQCSEAQASAIVEFYIKKHKGMYWDLSLGFARCLGANEEEAAKRVLWQQKGMSSEDRGPWCEEIGWIPTMELGVPSEWKRYMRRKKKVGREWEARLKQLNLAQEGEATCKIN